MRDRQLSTKKVFCNKSVGIFLRSMRLDASVISNIAILKTLFDLLYSRVVLSVDQGLSGFQPPNLFNFAGRLFFKGFLANLP